jgi:hypothetical protein
MTTLAKRRVDLGREARRFGVVPQPGDRPPPLGSRLAEPEPLFGPFRGRPEPVDLEALAERLGPVLGH